MYLYLVESQNLFIFSFYIYCIRFPAFLGSQASVYIIYVYIVHCLACGWVVSFVCIHYIHIKIEVKKKSIENTKKGENALYKAKEKTKERRESIENMLFCINNVYKKQICYK